MTDSFANFLAQERERAGLTQAAVRERLAELGIIVSDATFGHWEKGRRTPQPRYVEPLARVFGWDDEQRGRVARMLAGFALDGEAA
jgi:transcriptional regulator with XRE-family HTH domain